MASSSSAAPPPPPPPPSPPWVDLPAEITAAILQKLGSIEMLATAERVCRTWRNICKDPATWRVIDMRGDDLELNYDLEKMCRHAVDRSHGQLLEVNLEYFASDDLLLYIAQRSGQLRCLRIVRGYNVTGEGLSQAVRKCPLLEELHLYYTSIDMEGIVAIGFSCPLLKSFKLNNQGYRYPHIECDEEALAVAASMPNLRHLQLFGNKMTNRGLTAILNGCPQLESLDLRRCFNVSLGGNLGSRCSQQLKDLRPPDDSSEDYAFDSEMCDCESLDEDFPSGFVDIDLMSEDDDSPFAYIFSDMEDEFSDFEFLSD